MTFAVVLGIVSVLLNARIINAITQKSQVPLAVACYNPLDIYELYRCYDGGDVIKCLVCSFLWHTSDVSRSDYYMCRRYLYGWIKPKYGSHVYGENDAEPVGLAVATWMVSPFITHNCLTEVRWKRLYLGKYATI